MNANDSAWHKLLDARAKGLLLKPGAVVILPLDQIGEVVGMEPPGREDEWAYKVKVPTLGMTVLVKQDKIQEADAVTRLAYLGQKS